MTQKVCEVCDEPLPDDWDEALCENCQASLDGDDEATEEEVEDETCEKSAPSVADTSSSVMPDETSTAVKSTFESLDALDAISDTGSESLDSPIPSSEASPSLSESPTEAEKLLECESCGFRQKTLTKFKHPMAADSIEMCDKCFAAETALVNHADDPMQGKVVHPDEASREEIITMDDEDKELYNKEVLICVASPIEDVYARIQLLEGKLQRAKLQLKASRTTLLMRVESMKKEDRERTYLELNARDEKRRKRAAAPGGVPKERTSGGFSTRSRRTKTEQFKDAMRNNGMSEETINAMIISLGIKD